MTAAPDADPLPPVSMLPTTARAALMATRRHSGCDDLAAAALERIDGEQVVYCSNCGQPLLRWGGA